MPRMSPTHRSKLEADIAAERIGLPTDRGAHCSSARVP